MPGLTPQVGFTRLEASYNCADLGQARGPLQSIDLRKNFLAKKMDARLNLHTRQLKAHHQPLGRHRPRMRTIQYHGKSGFGTAVPQRALPGYWMPRLKWGMTTREVGEESLS